MSNCPGILISELQTMNLVSEEDYIVINDNNKITKRVSYVDFVGSLNQNPNVRLTTYANDVLILSPTSTENPLWLRISSKSPHDQEQANNIIVNELVRQKDYLTSIDIRLTEVEKVSGNYATVEYVDNKVYIEKTEREAADAILNNIKADKYNHYTKAEIDQMLAEIIIDAGGLPDAPSNGGVYGRQDASWVHVVEEAAEDGTLYARKDGEWTEIVIPDTTVDLGLANRNDKTLDITSSTGASVTIPEATTVLAGLMTAADKAALNNAASGTDLGIDNRNTATLEITSSTGNEVIVPSATLTLAGLMTANDKSNLESLVATGGTTDLSVGNLTGTTLDVVSSTGTDATLPSATTTTAGLLSATDKVGLDDLIATGGNTDLGIDNRTATTLDVTSSTGNDATVPAASTIEAGLMLASDKVKLDSVNAGAEPNVNPTQIYTPAVDKGTLVLSPGSDATDLPLVDNTNAGLMSPSQKASLESLVATGGNTNLGVANITATTLDVTSNTGTDATLPSATSALAGLMTASDKSKLDALGQTIDFQGSVDLTDSATIPGAPADGDAYANNTDGQADAGWAAVSDLAENDTVSAGDLVIWDGTDWAYIPTGGTQYTDADVDAHLNQPTATAGQVLSYDGSDYDWVDPAAAVQLGDTPPEPASASNQGDLWWNTSDARLYISYTDPSNDSAWVDASPGGTGGDSGGGDVAGANTQVQFNDAGAFGAHTAFTYDKNTARLTTTNLTASTIDTSSVSSSAAGTSLDLSSSAGQDVRIVTGGLVLADNAKPFIQAGTAKLSLINANNDYDFQANTSAASLLVKGSASAPGEVVLYPPTGVTNSWAVKLRAPETATTDNAPITQYSLTLPPNKPQASQFLQTDATGQLSFVDSSAYEGLQSGDNVSELVNDAGYLTSVSTPTLQQVTDAGNSTTNEITVNSNIALKANGTIEALNYDIDSLALLPA